MAPLSPATDPPPLPSEHSEDGLDARVLEFVLIDVDDVELPIAHNRRESLAPCLAHPPLGAVAGHPDRVRRLAVTVRDELDGATVPTTRRGVPPGLHYKRVVDRHAVHRFDARGEKIGDSIDVPREVTLAARGSEGAGDADQNRQLVRAEEVAEVDVGAGYEATLTDTRVVEGPREEIHGNA